MKILVDAFGGDNSPEQIIQGTIDAVNEKDGFTAVLVGKEDIIKEELKKYSFNKERVEILHASEVITCEEEPTVAIRRKPDSSLCVAFKELKENDEVAAFVSAGSTGAVLVGATLKLGRIKGVNRPALCPALPTVVEGKRVFLLDCGANADCKPINLVQFALMGVAYAESMGVENPRVALLSNGTEDEKGNMLIHEVLPMLKSIGGLNFAGNIEGRDIMNGNQDVVVCDGFSGNVALKAIEGAVISVMKSLKKGVYSSLSGKIGGLFLKKTFKKLKEELDYQDKGGALFIGVNKPVIKSHGSSNAFAIKNTVLQAVGLAGFNISDKITQKLALYKPEGEN
ncbi:MAG: phosphate acyltransferase PlsX [Clostridia bacterium]|nr:phosphate acyltransferase PlsX [Clostridia bacterium]